jgi:hypothetical protein
VIHAAARRGRIQLSLGALSPFSPPLPESGLA